MNMIPIANSGRLAIRYGEYIRDLQEFFALHRLAFGSPDDIVGLVRRLSVTDGFPPELASMARSFLFRERGAISRSELLGIVAVAVGGLGMEDAADRFQQQIGTLFDFLNQIEGPPVDQTSRDRSTIGAAAFVAAVMAPPPSEPLQSAPTLAEERPAAPDPFVVNDSPSLMATERRRTTSPPLLPAPATSSRAPWAIGACALLFLVIVAGVLHSRSTGLSDLPPIPGPTLSSSASTPGSASPLPGPSASNVVPQLGGQASIGSQASTLALNQPLSVLSPVIPLASTSSLPSTVLHRARQQRAPRTNQPADRSFSSAQAPASTVASTSAQLRPEPTPAPTEARAAEPEARSPTFQARTATPAQPPAARAEHTPPVPAKPAAIPTPSALSLVSSGFMTSHLLSAPPPRYPKFASMTHVEGSVIVQAVVAKDGSVSVVHVLRGHHLLRGAAVNAVSKWRYRPYVTHGHAVDVSTIVTVNFQLP